MKTVEEILAEIDRRMSLHEFKTDPRYAELTSLEDWITKREPREWLVCHNHGSSVCGLCTKRVKVREVLDDDKA